MKFKINNSIYFFVFQQSLELGTSCIHLIVSTFKDTLLKMS